VQIRYRTSHNLNPSHATSLRIECINVQRRIYGSTTKCLRKYISKIIQKGIQKVTYNVRLNHSFNMELSNGS
jgi:hypothetical protein